MEQAEELSPRDHGLKLSQIVDEKRGLVLIAEVTSACRKALVEEGLPAMFWTDAEVRTHSSDAFMESVWQQACADYAIVLNFVLGGSRTYVFGDVAMESAHRIPVEVPAVDLKLPEMSCAFVYDDQLIREAIHAGTQAEVPREGPVTCWLTTMDTEGEGRAISMTFVHVLAGTVRSRQTRFMVIPDGVTVADLLSGRNDPLVRAVALSMLHLAGAGSSGPGRNTLPDGYDRLPSGKRRFEETILDRSSRLEFSRVHDGRRH
jgi:hypothetical protein